MTEVQSQRNNFTRYSFRYSGKIPGEKESRKLLKKVVNRGGLEPPTR